MGEVIVITSGKGGVGKTTTAANLGVGLAKAGKKVLLADMDIGLRKLDLLLGLENMVVYNLLDLINKRCLPEQAIVQADKWPGLYMLSTPQTVDKTAVTPEDMAALMEEIKDDFDYVILDCPAGIERGFQNAIAGATRAIVVTVPEIPAVRDADRVIGLMRERGITQIGLVINKVRPHLVAQGVMVSKEDIAEIIPEPIIGIIPDDDQVIVASGKGTPAVEGSSLGGQAYRNITARVLGQDIPFLELGQPAKKLTWRERRQQKKQAKMNKK